MSNYEHDFYGWTQEQATLLRAHDFTHVDLDHLIEEIESMGRSERRQLTHLLQWQHQPELQGRSWALTMAEQRRRIAKLLRTNPSLQPELAALLSEAYEDATFSAIRETGLPLTTFPETCPYTLAQVMAQDWLPT